LVSAYREHGHKQANIDPILLNKPSLLPELQSKNFGLNLTDKVHFQGILFTQQNEGTIEEAIRFLNLIYSDVIGAEFTYLEVIFIDVIEFSNKMSDVNISKLLSHACEKLCFS